jgi:hypothetical protein
MEYIIRRNRLLKNKALKTNFIFCLLLFVLDAQCSVYSNHIKTLGGFFRAISFCPYSYNSLSYSILIFSITNYLLYQIESQLTEEVRAPSCNTQSIPISEMIIEIGNIVQSITLLSNIGSQQGYPLGSVYQSQFNFQEEPGSIHQIYGLRSKKPLLLSTILIIAILCLYEWKESSGGRNSVYKTIL